MARKVFRVMFVICLIALFRAPTVHAAGEAEKTALAEHAAKPDSITILKEFRAASKKFREENAITDVSTLKPEVVAYYTDQFGKEYEKKNGGAKFPQLDAFVNGLWDDQTAMQYYYISKNSNPLGSKNLLDRGEDKSAYSTLHAKYHPALRKHLEELGLYDIFFVDAETGIVVYTQYKELDFMCNLKAGPNASSGLAEAFKKALTAKKGEVVESSVDKYGLSYDVLALFIGTPLYDGNKLEGVLLYQVNP